MIRSPGAMVTGGVEGNSYSIPSLMRQAYGFCSVMVTGMLEPPLASVQELNKWQSVYSLTLYSLFPVMPSIWRVIFPK
jgi:hypothetical protein